MAPNDRFVRDSGSAAFEYLGLLAVVALATGVVAVAFTSLAPDISEGVACRVRSVLSLEVGACGGGSPSQAVAEPATAETTQYRKTLHENAFHEQPQDVQTESQPADPGPQAASTGPQTAGTDFYSAPADLSGSPGDIIRSEPSSFFLDPLQLIPAPATAQRVMYQSSDRNGTPIAVTGTVLTPTRAWTGPGERPVIAYAVGTQGLGDQCAPSRQLEAGTEYEGLFIAGLLARGYGVVVTDYQGLGTPGVHTYMSREVSGRAVLDSIRAAQRLPEAGLPDAGPVAITGYSQGGGAAASAAEIAQSYASELALKGVVAGAVPAEQSAVAQNLDGSKYFPFLGYALAGLSESYGVETDPLLNQRGRDVLAALKEQCTGASISAYGKVESSTLTADGRPITALLDEEPYRSMVAEQLIGDGRKPAVPVLITHSTLDDVIPYAVGRDLAARWCAQGAAVRLGTNAAPGHAVGAIRSYPEAFLFLEARFADKPLASSCWRL